MENNLRGAILSVFPSISAFARAIKWDRKKASRIVNKKQEPTTQDIRDIVMVLGINDANDFVNLFFSDLSPMWTK